MWTPVRSAVVLVTLLGLATTTEGCFITPTRGGLAIVGIRPGVVVYRQPPPPRQVVVVRPAAPSAQATWVEGHWQWDGRQYVWVNGYWAEYRRDQRYVAPRWSQQGNGWVYYEGYYAPVR